MTIGDWEVEITKVVEIVQPDVADPTVERFVTYNFWHKPSNVKTVKVLILRKKQNDDEVEHRRILEIVAGELKTSLVDSLFLMDNDPAGQQLKQ